MDILDLLGTLGIEVDELLASWGTCSLLEVGRQTSQKTVGLLCNSIGLIDRLGLIGGMVLLVEASEGRQEAVGDTMLAIEVDGLLDGLIA